mmetsp:Transcript_18867/g.32473  ORF Transcript_18867/g.32473 Transcript_18867/m.32473 type:complete len:144 (+) Transcript_18867:41-472(+)
MVERGTKILSSLPFQVLVYFNSWYCGIYFWLNIAIFIYKGLNLPYPPNTFGWEVVFIVVYVPVELCRLFLGSKGNKTEHAGPMYWFLLLSAPVAFGNIYYMILQIYVLRIDQVLNVINLVFIGLEVIFAIFAIITFHRYRLVM